jgi:hypothetical protein
MRAGGRLGEVRQGVNLPAASKHVIEVGTGLELTEGLLDAGTELVNRHPNQLGPVRSSPGALRESKYARRRRKGEYLAGGPVDRRDQGVLVEGELGAVDVPQAVPEVGIDV